MNHYKLFSTLYFIVGYVFAAALIVEATKFYHFVGGVFVFVHLTFGLLSASNED